MINKFISSLAGQLLLALLGLAIVSACSMRPVAESKAHNGLTDTNWQLKTISDYQHDLDPKRLPTMSFTADRMSGSNGCNQMFGNYTLGSDGSISFGHLGTTRKLCVGNAGELENAINKALADTHLYALSRNELNFLDKQRKVLMVLKQSSHSWPPDIYLIQQNARILRAFLHQNNDIELIQPSASHTSTSTHPDFPHDPDR